MVGIICPPIPRVKKNLGMMPWYPRHPRLRQACAALPRDNAVKTISILYVQKVAAVTLYGLSYSKYEFVYVVLKKVRWVFRFETNIS